jgi:hypothetical protein
LVLSFSVPVEFGDLLRTNSNLTIW